MSPIAAPIRLTLVTVLLVVLAAGQLDAQKYCGTKLTQALNILCDGQFNPMRVIKRGGGGKNISDGFCRTVV